MKCSAEKFCRAMDREVQRRSDVKGLSLLVLLDVKTGNDHVAGVVYKSDPRKKGILLNVCPWCASPINFMKKAGV